jgi:hypothetical protein
MSKHWPSIVSCRIASEKGANAIGVMHATSATDKGARRLSAHWLLRVKLRAGKPEPGAVHIGRYLFRLGRPDEGIAYFEQRWP